MSASGTRQRSYFSSHRLDEGMEDAWGQSCDDYTCSSHPHRGREVRVLLAVGDFVAGQLPTFSTGYSVGKVRREDRFSEDAHCSKLFEFIQDLLITDDREDDHRRFDVVISAKNTHEFQTRISLPS